MGLETINHIVWRYSFGPFTRSKFITSHYHILYLAKSKAKRTFNTYCRFEPLEIDQQKRSYLNSDLEDVFIIHRENHTCNLRNSNKLPKLLIEKLIQYSSNPGDTIVDLFLGNFTTAYVGTQLDRRVIGFEINPSAFEYHVEILRNATGESFGTIRETGMEDLKQDHLRKAILIQSHIGNNPAQVYRRVCGKSAEETDRYPHG